MQSSTSNSRLRRDRKRVSYSISSIALRNDRFPDDPQHLPTLACLAIPLSLRWTLRPSATHLVSAWSRHHHCDRFCYDTRNDDPLVHPSSNTNTPYGWFSVRCS